MKGDKPGSDKADQEELGRALEEGFKQVSGASGQAVGEFAALQERRIERLKATQEYLKSTLGEDHPEVIALGLASKETEELKDALRARSDSE
jgi:hypothetical protein